MKTCANFYDVAGYEYKVAADKRTFTTLQLKHKYCMQSMVASAAPHKNSLIRSGGERVSNKTGDIWAENTAVCAVPFQGRTD